MSDNFVNPFKKTAKKLIILIKKKRNTKKSFKTNNMDKSMRYNEKYVELMDDLAYIMRFNKEFLNLKLMKTLKIPFYLLNKILLNRNN